MDSFGSQLFREVQRLRQPWLWLLVLAVAAIAWIAFALQVVPGRPVGNEPSPDWILWIVLAVVGVGLPTMFAACRLVTIVDRESVIVRIFPIFGTRLDLADIREAFPRAYHPLREYWGWGLKWTPQGGWAYTLGGYRGVQLVFRDGRRVLIGSRRPDELAAAIQARMSPSDAGPASPE